MRPIDHLRNEKGFSFIEAILTTLILAVGLMGGMLMLQTVSQNSFTNDMRVTANLLAQEKIEAIIADKAFLGFNAITTANYPQEALAAPFSGFTRRTTVTEVSSADLTSASAGSGYKKVVVIVSWGDEDFEQVSFSTLITNYS